MAEMSDEFITISEADARGYGSRPTIMRYVKKNQVRSYMSGSTRLVSANDLKRIAAMRNDGVRPSVDMDREVERLGARIATIMPALSSEQKQRLSELLSA